MKNHIIRLYVKIIKINIKGYLKSLNNNEIKLIETKGVKKNNELSYYHNKINHKLIIDNDKILLTRENEEFKNILEFSKNKTIQSEYILKENNYKVFINIKTLRLEKTTNTITIKYKIIDSNEIYEYKIEMR